MSYSLPQCIQVAISLSILFTYALQFYVPIAIIWPKIVNRFGPFKWPVLSETIFRSAMCFLTCKFHIKLISKLNKFYIKIMIDLSSDITWSNEDSFELWCSFLRFHFFLIASMKVNLINFYFITVVLAEAIPQLGLFISLVGAVSSTALALIFPPLIEMVVCWQNASLSFCTISKDIVIILIGLLGFVTGTYESLTSIIQAFST